jgi:small subunit ribosomal protein S1
VRIKVLDIDRDRQRISLGLKQTQEDPWQRVISTHRPGDVLEGTVTKVVAFGAFVEILPGVEGLVHISELADHHVENPRDVVNQGDEVNVKVIEIDPERRRLSLSLKRVEVGDTVKRIEMDGITTALAESVPELGLSSEVFADVEEEPASGDRPDLPEPVVEADAIVEADLDQEPVAAEEPEPEPAPEPEPEAAAEPEPEQPAEEASAEPEEALAEE